MVQQQRVWWGTAKVDTVVGELVQIEQLHQHSLEVARHTVIVGRSPQS